LNFSLTIKRRIDFVDLIVVGYSFDVEICGYNHQFSIYHLLLFLLFGDLLNRQFGKCIILSI
jgi:hypothetical protein